MEVPLLPQEWVEGDNHWLHCLAQRPKRDIFGIRNSFC
jgi:hypothetical protein